MVSTAYIKPRIPCPHVQTTPVAIAYLIDDIQTEAAVIIP